MLYEKGRSISAAGRTRLPKYKGKLRIQEARISSLGRMATVANLVSVTDGCEGALLPVLHDVAVIWVENEGMRIRGFEIVEGAQYAQTWDLKVC